MIAQKPLDENKKIKFLMALSETGRIMEACNKAGIAHNSMRLWRAANAEFAEEIQCAFKVYAESLEREAHRRGVEGYEEPVFGNMGPGMGSGEVGRVRKFSDRLLEIMLKKNNPEFRDSVKVDANFSGGVLVVERAAATVPEWKQRYEGTDEAPAEAPA